MHIKCFGDAHDVQRVIGVTGHNKTVKAAEAFAIQQTELTHALQSVHKRCRTLKKYFTEKLAPRTIVAADGKRAQDTRDVFTYLYGVVQHMQNTHHSAARVSNVALHLKLMKLQKTDNSIAFLTLKNP